MSNKLDHDAEKARTTDFVCSKDDIKYETEMSPEERPRGNKQAGDDLLDLLQDWFQTTPRYDLENYADEILTIVGQENERLRIELRLISKLADLIPHQTATKIKEIAETALKGI